MKILIVNTNDIFGGASRGAYTLHRGLIKLGIDSKMIVKNKTSNDNTVFSVESRFRKKIIDKIAAKHEEYIIKKYKNSVNQISIAKYSSFQIVKFINSFNADIVNLQWINDRFLKIEDIAKINAPIVWTMRDMWPFSSGYHYDQEYKFSNDLNDFVKVSKTEINNDLNKEILQRKVKCFNKIKNLTFAGISNWLCEEAKKSIITKKHNIIHIGNGINTEVFCPKEKLHSRDVLCLPKNKVLILFGAMQSTSDVRKGFNVTKKLLEEINDKNVEFVVFGDNKDGLDNSNNRIHFLGHINDDNLLSTLYSACDIFINPSLQEGFGKVTIEAMACGTPVVAFGHTGFLDTINHKTNGYLARPFNVNDFLNGINWCIENKNDSNLKKSCRNNSLKYSEKLIAKKYYNLYNKIIKK